MPLENPLNTGKVKIESKRTDALPIYKKINSDFTLPANITNSKLSYKHSDKGTVFSARYDEPTYLTFRIEFEEGDGGGKWTKGFGRYDEMPHPLFYRVGEKNLQNSFSGDANIGNVADLTNIKSQEDFEYSAYQYLYNSLGEDLRAEYLEQFKNGLWDIQKYYPYYFTSISGLNNLMKIDTEAGRRVKEDSKIITITCNEAIDLRITQLMTLYKRVVWDDVYQRWILPDMMRFFKMKIFISEIRLFHYVKGSSQLPTPLGVDLAPGSILGKKFELISNAMNEVMPTIVLDCEQCEFDLSETNAHMDTLQASKTTEQLKPVIKIKVGNIKETHVYGLNKNMENAIHAANESISNRIPKLEPIDILSDLILQEYMPQDDDTFGDKSYQKSLLDAISAHLNSTTLKREGSDMSKDTYEAVFNTSIQNAKLVSGLLKNYVPSMRDVERELDKNMSDALKNYGIHIPIGGSLADFLINPLERLTEYGVRQLNTVMHNSIIDAKQALLNSKWGDGFATAGQIIDGLLLGNPYIILKAIKDAIYGSTAVGDGIYMHNINMGPDALTHVLREISLKSDPADDAKPLLQEIDWMLNSGMSATDIGRTIDNKFDDAIKGLSSEANEDTDKGYSHVELNNPPYASSATNGTIGEQYDITNKGLSNEAIQDKDMGFQNPGMVQTPYVSTANTGSAGDVYKKGDKGLSNEAIQDTDAGFQNPGMRQPSYRSTANTGAIGDVYARYNKGLSNEAIQDRDRGFKRPRLNQPPYRSTANMGYAGDVYEEHEKGLSNEAIEDRDRGFKTPGLINPEYLSSANEGSADSPYDDKNRGMSNEAIEDKDKGFQEQTMNNPEYASSATSRTEINSCGLINPQYLSTATQRKVELDKGDHVLSSEATENKE